jgi:heptosyltransferase-2
MPAEGDILEALRRCEAEAERTAHRAVIIQPGAIGDCVLTLPLAEFVRKSLDLGRLDLLSHTEYTGALPGRSCIDGVRSIESMELHRLFVAAREFDLADYDPLMLAFEPYQWILSFLGETDSDFEQNLIFTANCSHGAEVITLQLKPPADWNRHICDFYIRQLVGQTTFTWEYKALDLQQVYVRTTTVDAKRGRQLLGESGLAPVDDLVIIHPGAGAADKMWNLDNFCWLTERMHRRGRQVVLLLGPAELDRLTAGQIRALHDTGPCLSDLPLCDVLALLSCARLFIGNDSGISHLSSAAGIMTVAVFGPTDPAVYQPLGPAVQVFRLNPQDFTQPSPASVEELLEATK